MKERKNEKETAWYIVHSLGAERLSPTYISNPRLIYRRHLNWRLLAYAD